MTDILNDPINSFFQYTCKTANVKSNSSVCVGTAINLTSSGGAGYSYSWSGPNDFTSNLQNPNITNAAPAMAGAYTITVIAAPGCTDTDTINLIVIALPATPTITPSGPLTFCAGGSVTLTSSAGSTYLWSNGATTSGINVTASGSYSVRVTDPGGCLSAASAATVVKVNVLPVTPTITAGGPTAFCAGGSVTLTSSAGSGYLWSNGATTASINVTASGSYTVRVTDANGCLSVASVSTIVTVNALPVPTISTSGPTTFCNGGSVILTSGTGSTYLWSTGATTASINITASGSYTVRVTDAYGCQSATSSATIITVNSLPATPTITAGGTTTFCAGGSVTLASSAGTSYLWSNAATTQNININKSGSYTVKVTDATGCQSLASVATAVTVNSFPAIPTITAGGPTAFCTGGSVILTSSTGTSYLWSNGATTPNINITAAGSYTVQVANAGGCQSPASVATIVTVNDLPAPTIGAGGPTTFCEGGSVNLTLTSSAGTGYLWSNGATTPGINVTTAGSYTLQVTNASGCQSAASSATIVNVIALPVVNAGTDVTIPINTGTTIDATVTGTGPFTYSWSPSSQLADATDATIEDPTTNILATTTVFTLTATSITTGCSNTNSVTITISGGALSSTPTASPGTICAGANVQLNAMASGGSGPYTYTWTSIPAEFTSSVATPIANPTVNTTYYVAVSDGSATVNSPVSVTVNALPATPTITAVGPTTFCAGGTVNLTLTSSAGTSYLWSNAATTQNIDVITAGSYTVRVTNASGCLSAPSQAKEVTVNPLPVTPTITAVGPTAFCSGGSVILNSSSGTSYIWSNAVTTSGINVTTPGSYTVRVRDASGCLSAASVATIVTISALPVTPAITAGGPTSFCTGGSVTLTSSAGISYLWSNAATTQNITVTTPGNYTVKVTNISGCQSAVSAATVVTVNALPGIPIITAGGPITFCAGGNVTLNSSAGTSYLWSNAATTPGINITSAGSYTVKVTNASGCQSAASAATVVTVNALPVIPTITAGGPTAFCAGGSVTLTSSAGTGNLWSNGTTTQSINATMAGSYTVKVTNAGGCQSAPSVATIVTVNALPSASITITDNSGIANNDGIICSDATATLSAFGGTYYMWSSGETTAVIVKGAAGTYTVTVTNANGCTDTEAANITVNAVPIATAGSNSPVCAENTIDLTSSGGKDYTWSGPDGFTSDNQSDNQNPKIHFANKVNEGIYTVTVSATNGCTATNTTSVIVNPLPIVTVRSNSPVCVGNTINLTSSSDGTDYTYSWSGPNGFTSILQNPSISPADTTMSGAYKLTVTAVTGCTVTKKTIVKISAFPTAAITLTDNSGIANNDGIICYGAKATLTASDGTGYIYSWSSGETTASITKGTAGTYTVTVTNANGCTDTEAATITVNVLPIAAITITDNSEIENNDGIICNGATATLTASGGTSYIWSSGETTAAITKGTAGTYIVTVTNANGCTDTATAKVVVNALPVVEASNNGPVFSFKALSLTGGPEGMTTYSWTGSGGFTSNSQSPSVSTSALAAMAGVYTLTVTNSSGCTNTDTTTVEINELPVPSVITPNGDGKNDYFVIGEIIGKVDLIIFNRWGNEEYTNSNYLNDWDGRNNKGTELPNDTYFYILKFESGKVIKGSVLIKR